MIRGAPAVAPKDPSIVATIIQCTQRYDITMHDIVELIKWSVGAREKGNKAFEEGEYSDAYMDYVHVSHPRQLWLYDREV